MERVMRFARSAIGRKIMMALTGLGLVVFLIAHLIGNLLIFKGEDEFNGYTESMTSNMFLYVLEAGLLTVFLYHAVNGTLLFLKNRKARKEGYGRKDWAGGASRKSVSSMSMLLTGILILGFVVIHLAFMKYGEYYTTQLDGKEVRDMYRLVVEKFTDPLWAGFYMFFMAVVGFHLHHALGTVLDSLGVRHRSFIRYAGQGLGIAISAGFFFIPLYVLIAH